MKVLPVITLFAVGIVMTGNSARAQTVYTNNFSATPGSEWSNTSIATSNSESFLATSANGFGNGTVTLTLSNLPAHQYVTLNFDLYIIQSMDGNGQNGGGPDDWRLNVAGTTKILTNFANYTGGNTQAYPAMVAPLGAGANNPPRTGDFDNGHLGFGTGDFGDSTYRFSVMSQNSASSISFDFTSLQTQAPGDEGWGLDNVSVSVSMVPEPTLLLPIISLMAFPMIIRRRILGR